MAFCRNCGAEVSDNAFICTKCGSLINPEKKKIAKTNEQDVGFHNSASFWLAIVSIPIVVVSESYIDHLVSFIGAILAFGLIAASYGTSFKLVREGIITKTVNYTLLMLMIASLAFAIFKIIFFSWYW